MDLEKWRHPALIAFGIFSFAVIVFMANSGAGDIAQTLGNVFGGLIGAAGAFLGVYAALHGDRQREVDRLAEETNRIRSLLCEEMRLMAMNARARATVLETTIQSGNGNLHAVSRVLEQMSFRSPRIYHAMIPRLDLLDVKECRALILFYEGVEETEEREIRYRSERRLVDLRMVLEKHALLCKSAEDALARFGIDPKVLTFPDRRPTKLIDELRLVAKKLRKVKNELLENTPAPDEPAT